MLLGLKVPDSSGTILALPSTTHDKLNGRTIIVGLVKRLTGSLGGLRGSCVREASSEKEAVKSLLWHVHCSEWSTRPPLLESSIESWASKQLATAISTNAANSRRHLATMLIQTLDFGLQEPSLPRPANPSILEGSATLASIFYNRQRNEKFLGPQTNAAFRSATSNSTCSIDLQVPQPTRSHLLKSYKQPDLGKDFCGYSQMVTTRQNRMGVQWAHYSFKPVLAGNHPK